MCNELVRVLGLKWKLDSEYLTPLWGKADTYITLVKLASTPPFKKVATILQSGSIKSLVHDT